MGLREWDFSHTARYAEREQGPRRAMNFFSGAIVGYFMGFGFGLGCALAAMYSIFLGGYRKAVEDSLREEKSDRWRRWLPVVETKMRKARLKV
jgi:hypothetical protein